VLNGLLGAVRPHGLTQYAVLLRPVPSPEMDVDGIAVHPIIFRYPEDIIV
jgi:hypothetical protein